MRLVTLRRTPARRNLTEGTILAVLQIPRARRRSNAENLFSTTFWEFRAAAAAEYSAAGRSAQGFDESRPHLARNARGASRKSALRSCHDQMDPLGLALENFNSRWACGHAGISEPIEVAGISHCESFTNVQELKQIWSRISRGFLPDVDGKNVDLRARSRLGYYDVETVDQIVARVEKSGGKPSALFAE